MVVAMPYHTLLQTYTLHDHKLHRPFGTHQVPACKLVPTLHHAESQLRKPQSKDMQIVNFVSALFNSIRAIHIGWVVGAGITWAVYHEGRVLE